MCVFVPFYCYCHLLRDSKWQYDVLMFQAKSLPKSSWEMGFSSSLTTVLRAA